MKHMPSIAEKLSRVSALSPKTRVHAGIRPISRSAADSERLMRLLNGERRSNSLGSYIRVRSDFAEPRTAEVSPWALRLLAASTSGLDDLLYDLRNWLFLDTETTGLAGGTGTYAFLVGIAWWEGNGFVVEQYFMRDHSDEPSLMTELSERLARHRVLVTFNGKSFDWPLLRTRFQMTRVKTFQEPLLHLDLLHPSRQIWRLRLKSVALTQLENHVLGFDRGHDIPSSSIPQRYFDFLRGGPAELITEIFRHNQWDLCGLAMLAMRLATILEDPVKNGCDATELFGISRFLQRRGEEKLAAKFYRKAIESGLPKAAEQTAQKELALLAKQWHDFELSKTLWEKLLGGSADGLKAYEQLAIYYEHRARLPHKAVKLSREALVQIREAFHNGCIPEDKYMRWHASFRHRLTRLAAKVASQSSH